MRQELQVPQTVNKVFEEANRTVGGEENKLTNFLIWLLQTWLVNILLSPVLLYLRLAKAVLLILPPLAVLDGWPRKTLEYLVNLVLGNSFVQNPKFPLAR